MATYLADTNLPLRLADPASPQHTIAIEALSQLLLRRDEVFLKPQNFIEFWAVASRPVAANGLGWNRERTVQQVAHLQKQFPLLEDSPEIFPRWLDLMQQFPVGGKRVHDTADFATFSALSLVDPRSLTVPPDK